MRIGFFLLLVALSAVAALSHDVMYTTFDEIEDALSPMKNSGDLVTELQEGGEDQSEDDDSDFSLPTPPKDLFSQLEDATQPPVPEDEEDEENEDDDEDDDQQQEDQAEGQNEDQQQSTQEEEEEDSQDEDQPAEEEGGSSDDDDDSSLSGDTDSEEPVDMDEKEYQELTAPTFSAIAPSAIAPTSSLAPQKPKQPVNWGLLIKNLMHKMIYLHGKHMAYLKKMRAAIDGVDKTDINHHRGWVKKMQEHLKKLRHVSGNLKSRIAELHDMYNEWEDKGANLVDMKWWRAMVRKHFGKDGTAGRWGKWARNLWKNKLHWKPFWDKWGSISKHWGKKRTDWLPPAVPMHFPGEVHVVHGDDDEDFHKKKSANYTVPKNDRLPLRTIPKTWREFIIAGRVFGVAFDRTADKFDDSTYQGIGDPLGPIKGGGVYSLRFSPKFGFLARGYNQQDRKDVTEVSHGPDPGDHKISIWGHIFTFDTLGRVYSPRWGLVGHLQGCNRCPKDTEPESEKRAMPVAVGEEPPVPRLDPSQMVPAVEGESGFKTNSANDKQEDASAAATTSSWDTPIPEQDPALKTNNSTGNGTTSAGSVDTTAAPAATTAAPEPVATTAAPEPVATTAAAAAPEPVATTAAAAAPAVPAAATTAAAAVPVPVGGTTAAAVPVGGTTVVAPVATTVAAPQE